MPDPTHRQPKRPRLARPPDERDDRAVQELADHLEELYREALDRGATEDEAREYVEQRLGETAEVAAAVLARVRERLGDRLARWAEEREDRLRDRGGIATALADRVRDLRLAARSLARCPAFTGIVVVVLALGIGASTAIFTLVDAVVLSPLPFEEAERLMAVSHTGHGRGLYNVGQCAAWHLTYEEENEVFEDIGMWGLGSAAVTGGAEPEAVSVMVATSGVFRALRLQPVLGRMLNQQDEDLEAPNELLLGYGYWKSRYGGNPDVVHGTLEVEGQPWEIVGVLPRTLRGLDLDPQIIVPMRFDREQLFVGNIGYDAVARLRPGVTREQALADMGRMLPMAWEKFPGGPVASSNAPSDYVPVLQELKHDIVGSAARLLWVLLGCVAVVLVIACANVANLFLVRSEAKETEMAVRTVIGANGGRVAWEYLKESLVLGMLGGLAGLVLAFVCLRVVLAAELAPLPRLDEVSLSPRVFLFALAVSVGAGLMSGIVPALRRGATGLVDTLKQGGQGGMRSRDRRRVQNGLAVVQMALTLVLLVASGLMLRSFWALYAVDPGFGNPRDVLSFRISVPYALFEDGGEAALVHQNITRRLAEIPGVESVGLASGIPMGAGSNVNPFYVEGADAEGEGPPPMRRHKWIGEGYFETMQIPMVAGRTLTWNDVNDRSPVAIVSEGLARAYWGSPEAALDQRVAARPEPVRWHRVVGVVPDVREDGLDQDLTQMVYWPQVTLGFWEGSTEEDVQTWWTMAFVIRSPRVGDPDFFATVQDAVWSVNPNVPLRSIFTLSDLMADSVARTSSTLILLAVAGAVALILGVVGVYGVIAYAVARRSREIGTRIALGAQREAVMRMVLRQGFVLASVGVALGVALALALTRLMSSLLYEVSPLDPTTFVVVAAALLAVALLASYIPARRAAGVEPMEALRVE